MQLERGMSTSRYLPARGTAGFARSFVKGKRRLPAPPPIITDKTLLVFGDMRLPCVIKKKPFYRIVGISILCSSSKTQAPFGTAVLILKHQQPKRAYFIAHLIPHFLRNGRFLPKPIKWA